LATNRTVKRLIHHRVGVLWCVIWLDVNITFRSIYGVQNKFFSSNAHARSRCTCFFLVNTYAVRKLKAGLLQ
jgi:hypothetical protein